VELLVEDRSQARCRDEMFRKRTALLDLKVIQTAAIDAQLIAPGDKSRIRSLIAARLGLRQQEEQIRLGVEPAQRGKRDGCRTILCR